MVYCILEEFLSIDEGSKVWVFAPGATPPQAGFSVQGWHDFANSAFNGLAGCHAAVLFIPNPANPEWAGGR